VKCPNCSLQNPDTKKFCGDCGTSLLSDREGDVSRTTTIRLPAIPYPIGSIFAERYRIIEELGKGGMGRVIRALDMKLDEEIAIKFIRPDLTEDPAAVERFRIELKAARQVIHRNVARMFDLNEADGVPFITMEYVRGGDLKSLIKKMGRLDAQQAVRIIRQVAEGLAEAHRTGVIHRDMKPHNIMVDEEGTARITDFGLARLRKTDDATLTAPGMGTPAYASPEQVEGGTAVDSRSDLYSMGIVLFEMLTGELPFQGETPYSVALARLTKAPPDPRSIQPDIPEALVQVIMKCLQKDPGQRYQSANELILDLKKLGENFSTAIIPGARRRGIRSRAQRWILARRIPLAFLAVVVLSVVAYFIIIPPTPTPWKTSIAVLPVIDLNPQEESTNVWYGLRSEISAKLHNIPELKVLSIPSGYDPSGSDFQEIGKDLGAEYLLQLTLLTEGIKLRVRLDLIEVKTASIFKTYDYPTELESIYAVQDEISRQTARALRVNLVEERLRTFKKRETDNLVAYNHYLEGKRLIEEVYLGSYRPEDFTLAVSNYEKAIEIDPKYALAYWGLGNAYEARHYSPTEDSKDPADWQRMRDYYERAYEIEPDIAETNLGVGWVHFNLKDNVRASKNFKRAFELDPNNPIVNQDIGAFLRSVGLYDKAIKYLSRAAEIEPHSVSTRLLLSTSLMYLGEFDRAIDEAEKAIKEDPTSFEGRYYCATGLIIMNRLDDAQEEIDYARKIDPRREMNIPQALLWAAKGEKEKALELLAGKDITGVPATFVYIFLEMKREAIRNIEEGIEHGFEARGYYLYSYPILAENPVFKALKKEPGFQEILRREKAKHEEKLKNFAKL
jgi:serine/threonine protein kinase/Flp pilus assembly protein TadD